MPVSGDLLEAAGLLEHACYLRVETYHLLGGGLIIGGVVLAQVEGFLRAPAAAK